MLAIPNHHPPWKQCFEREKYLTIIISWNWSGSQIPLICCWEFVWAWKQDPGLLWHNPQNWFHVFYICLTVPLVVGVCSVCWLITVWRITLLCYLRLISVSYINSARCSLQSSPVCWQIDLHHWCHGVAQSCLELVGSGSKALLKVLVTIAREI